MKQHRWLALGAASMTTDQAKQWAELTGMGVADTPLEVEFSSVVCVVCGESYEAALSECFGSLDEEPKTAHLWQAFLTQPATDDEAAALSDPDEDFASGRPQAIAVICVICGHSADSAEESCPERAFWVDKPAPSSELLDPETIPDGTLVSAKPSGYDLRNDDWGDRGVPDYDASGIGPVIEGPLVKVRSSLGHTVFAVNGIAVEPESIELLAPAPFEDDPGA